MSDCEFLPDPPEGFRIASDAELTGELPSELQWTHATRGYWSHSRYAGKKFPTGKPRNSFYAVPLSTEPQPSALERRNAELTARLSKKQDDLDVQFGQLQESRRQVSELTARVAELESNQDQHIWVDGPHGSKYHCKRCGISKCDDHSCYDTCESWITQKVGGLERRLESEASAWLNLKSANDSLSAQLTEARKDGQWQPIETAPKDGKPFLAYVIIDANMEDRAEAKITIAGFDCTLDCFVQIDGSGNGYLEDEIFYYWMPLPATPLPSPKETK